MATYEDIYGKRVKEFDSDPTLESSYEGQVWYDKSTGVLKSVTASIAAWASAGPLLEARSSGAGFGTTTAAVYAGGQQPPGPGATNTFEYNGSGWSSGGALNTGRYEIGGTTAGIETAGLCFGGVAAPGGGGAGFSGSQATEEYNGSSWTSVNNMPTATSFLSGSGIQTAAFSAGGRTPSNTNASYEYDGTNWTAGNNINTTRQALVGMGTQTAGIIAGGEAPGGGSNSAEEYDGTNWTAAPNMGTARYRLSGSGSVSTASLVFGGRFNPPAADKAQTESFDGTSWTETADLATARQQLSGNRGTSSSALAVGGLPPPASQTKDTEEFTKSINTITAAAWSSGGALGTGRYQANGQNVGTKSAGLMIGGQGSYPPSNPAVTISNVEEYDGSSWSEVTNLPTTRAMLGSVGTQTAAFAFGGYGKPGGGPNPAPSSPVFDTTFNYDGSSWTSETAMPAAIAYLTGAGTQTAVVSIGGNPALTTCNEYDGSSWTSTGSLNTGRHNASAFGIQTAAIAAGGAPGIPVETSSETYNGSSWTANPTNIVGINQAGSAGTSTDGLLFGGSSSTTSGAVGYNGTIFFTQPNIANSRYGGSNGSTTAASAYFAGGGGGPPTRQLTEEFTGETSTITAATLTSS